MSSTDLKICFIDALQKFHSKEMIFILVGVLYGTTSVAVGHPFDTVKTKMQAQSGYEGNNMFSTFTKTLRTQGIRGLYRFICNKLIYSDKNFILRLSLNKYTSIRFISVYIIKILIFTYFRGCIPPLWGSGIYLSTQFAVFEAA